MPMCVLLLCVGHVEKASAKGETWYAKLTVKGGGVGKGYIYGNTANAPTQVYGADNVELDAGNLSAKNTSTTYYVWAKPVRGVVFNGWTLTNASLNTNHDGVADEINVTTPNSDRGGTTDGTATATWTTYKPCTVHLHASTDGAYRLDYTYTDWNDVDAFEEYKMAKILSIGGDNQDVQLYYTDQVSLSVTSGTFQGWYKDAEFTQPLTEATGSGPYTLAIPDNTASATEMHVYPKFQAQPKLFGRVNLDFAYGNTTDCGYIGITEVVDAEVNYSGTPIGCTHISLVADASTPTSQTYYLHAKPVNVEQNAFVGWFSSQIPSQSSLLSTELDYAYTFDASSTNESAPTIQNVYALFTRISTHYFEMTTEPREAGLGMVYASQTNATKPDYTYFTNYSQVLAEEIYLAGKDANTNFYLYAKPKYGYQFEGWYSDADCTVKVSGNNPYTYAASISSTDPNNPDKAHFYAKFVPATPISVTFEYPTTEGSYNVKAIDIVVSDDGEYEWGETAVLYNSAEETANKTIQIYPTDNLNFTAIPNAGNAVKSWKIAGDNVTSGSNNYTAAATSGKAYGVTFGASSPFMVGNQKYSTFDAAIRNLGTNKTIIVVENATVAAGHYTIPSGVTLLVPFDDTNKITTDHNSMVLENVPKAYNAARTCYRMLTLDPGVIIDVHGNLNVGANLASASGGQLGCGSINTAYGRIDMKSGSKINLKKGSNLYCWGIISGTDGLVTAESGSTVHEMLQHQSNPGGSAALGWDNKAFFMNQYYFQNIETPLRINYGATEKVYAELYIRGFQNANASLIGSDGLFRVNDASSYIVKSYDPSTDRTIYDMYGNASMVSLSMYVYVTIDTQKYPMPINNNMTIRCHCNGNASTVTLTYDIDLYPSAKVIIDEGVTLLVNGKLNVYDRDEWVNQGFAHRDLKDIARASFSPTRTHERKVAELEDAAIEVNGMMRVSGGLYTSTGKANIYSSGSGKILLEKSPSPTNAVYQYKNNKLTGILVPFTAAYLKNGNGSFVSTADASVNTTYTYFLGEWKANLTIDGCFAVDDAGHKYIAIDGGYKDVKESTIHSNAWVSRDAESMLFVHTADNCDWLKVFAVEGTTTYLKDVEGNYYEYNSTKGYWVPATQYTATFKNFNGKVLYTTKVFPNGTPVYKGATPIRPTDDEGVYSFNGWDPAITSINANTEYTAQYSKTAHVATVNSLGVTTYYTTWASALAAVNSQATNPTLKLLGDVSGISTVQTISNSMTLDLNGHTLSGTVSEMLKVNSDIIVTITDGSSGQTGVISSVGTATSGNYYTMSVAKGKVILENGTLKGKANGATVFPILIDTSGSFEMEGGRITTDATGTNNHGMLVKTKNTFIKGGTIDVPGAAVYISNGYSEAEKMTISGGYIKGSTIINPENSADTRVNVTGGYFSTDASLDLLVANPYHILDNEEDSKTTYPYTVAQAYKVTFKNGETVLQDGYVKVGARPAYTGENPTKDADAQYTYTFSTWSPAIEVVSTADQIYTAQFSSTLRSYTIIWQDENANELDREDVNYGVVPTHAALTKAADAQYTYSWKGWDNTPVAVTGPATYKSLGFTATPKSYTLTWNLDGGSVTTSGTEAGSVAYGTALTAPEVEKTGYISKGWSPTVPATMPAAAATYTAQWTPITYTITYNGNGLDGGSTASSSHTYDMAKALTTNGFTKTGYSFNGWNTAANGSGTSYTDGQSVTNLTTTNGATITLYAQWRVNQYTITFNTAGGSAIAPITQDYNTSVTPPANPTRPGYTFAGWNKEIPATMPAENMEITALWTPAETGDYLDIVDWTDNSLTINMNGYLSSNATPSVWSVTLNGGTTKIPGDRDTKRKITFDGLSLNGGDELTIEATNANNGAGTVDSRRTYKVPYLYTSNTTITSAPAADAEIWVKSGKLTINGTMSAKKIVVCPGAELEIASGQTLTITEALVLRTEAFSSAILTDKGTLNLPGEAKMYYTRIVEDKSQSYQFALPFDVTLANVKFSNGKTATRGTHYGLQTYNAANRAANGMGNNWETYSDATIAAKTGYQLISSSNYYCEFYFPVTYTKDVANAQVGITEHTSAKAADQGWNFICSPYTAAYNALYSDPAEGIKINELYDDNKNFHQYQPTVIKPAMPFYYQTNRNGNLNFGSYFTFMPGVPASVAARQTQQMTLATQWLQLHYANAAGTEDETNIYLNTDKFTTEYETGYDVVKLSTTGARPFLYTSLACGDLAFAALPDEAAQRIPLTVYSPANGEYTFSLTDNDYMDRMAAVYLVDEQTGIYTNLLSGGTYSVAVEQGTTTGRFYLMAEFAPAPGVATCMDEAEGAESITIEKVFIDGLFYIRRGGELYDWNGRLVK